MMMLLGFAKNLIESAVQARRSAAPALSSPEPSVPQPQPVTKPAASMTDEDLRALVDRSFVYLSRTQRAELLAGLDKALTDPANAAYRATILTQFVSVARQIEFTHGQLDRLSQEEKRTVADQFAANYRALDPAQQHALLEQLRQRALPVPGDLTEMMLSALAAPR